MFKTKNNFFVLILFIILTIKIWKSIVYVILALNIYTIIKIFILGKKKKKKILNKNILTNGILIKNIIIIKQKKKIEIIKHYIISYFFIFIFGFSLKILSLADQYITDLKNHILTSNKTSIIKFHIEFIHNRILYTPNKNIQIKFRKCTYVYIYNPALIINGMFITEFGPTLINNNIVIINLSLNNLFKNIKNIKKIYILRKKIQINKMPQLFAHTPEYVEEASLLKFFSKRSFNYWKYAEVSWYNTVNPTTSSFNKYSIKGVLVTNEKNIIKIKSSKKDALMALKLIEEKINFIENSDIKISLIKSQNFKMNFDWENDELDKINIFKELINEFEIELHSNSNDISNYITYPIINDIAIIPNRLE